MSKKTTETGKKEIKEPMSVFNIDESKFEVKNVYINSDGANQSARIMLSYDGYGPTYKVGRIGDKEEDNKTITISQFRKADGKFGDGHYTFFEGFKLDSEWGKAIYDFGFQMGRIYAKKLIETLKTNEKLRKMPFSSLKKITKSVRTKKFSDDDMDDLVENFAKRFIRVYIPNVKKSDLPEHYLSEYDELVEKGFYVKAHQTIKDINKIRVWKLVNRDGKIAKDKINPGKLVSSESLDIVCIPKLYAGSIFINENLISAPVRLSSLMILSVSKAKRREEFSEESERLKQVIPSDKLLDQVTQIESKIDKLFDGIEVEDKPDEKDKKEDAKGKKEEAKEKPKKNSKSDGGDKESSDEDVFEVTE